MALCVKEFVDMKEIFEGFYAKPFHLPLYSLFRMNSDGIACNTSVHSTESKIDRLIYCIKNECIGTVEAKVDVCILNSGFGGSIQVNLKINDRWMKH